MNRCWYGAGLLILLLIAGLLTDRWTERFYSELGERMEKAAILAESDRTAAQEIADSARDAWESRRKWAAVLQDHKPMEILEEYFRLLTPETAGDTFRETCLRLSAQLEALGAEQKLCWENLL